MFGCLFQEGCVPKFVNGFIVLLSFHFPNSSHSFRAKNKWRQKGNKNRVGSSDAQNIWKGKNKQTKIIHFQGPLADGWNHLWNIYLSVARANAAVGASESNEKNGRFLLLFPPLIALCRFSVCRDSKANGHLEEGQPKLSWHLRQDVGFCSPWSSSAVATVFVAAPFLLASQICKGNGGMSWIRTCGG